MASIESRFSTKIKTKPTTTTKNNKAKQNKTNKQTSK
jgi:hypothetical protein